MRKGGSKTETVKDVNGRLLRGNKARKRWAEYFEKLLNVQEDRGRYSGSRRCSGASNGGKRMREITIEVVKRALNETKGGKAPKMDGVRVEMLKDWGVTVLEWLASVYALCCQ